MLSESHLGTEMVDVREASGSCDFLGESLQTHTNEVSKAAVPKYLGWSLRALCGYVSLWLLFSFHLLLCGRAKAIRYERVQIKAK